MDEDLHFIRCLEDITFTKKPPIWGGINTRHNREKIIYYKYTTQTKQEYEYVDS